MIATTIFSLFLNGLFADYNILYLATKNISKTSFDAKTKYVKNTKSKLEHFEVKEFKILSGLLLCAHLCSGQFMLDDNCNAFSYDSSSAICKLANLTYLEDPSPGAISQVRCFLFFKV